MEKWEDDANLKGPVSAGELNDRLSEVYEFIGVINMSDLDKIRINELPLSFICYYNNHWVAIHISQSRLEIMDSTHTCFEKPCSEFINFLYMNKNKKIMCNPILQSAYTNVCGLYCIYFVLQKSLKAKYKYILKHFSNNVAVNDYIVKDLTKIKKD